MKKLLLISIILTFLLTTVFAGELVKVPPTSEYWQTTDQVLNSVLYDYFDTPGAEPQRILFFTMPGGMKINTGNLILDTSGIATALNIEMLKNAMSDSFLRLISQNKLNGDSISYIADTIAYNCQLIMDTIAYNNSLVKADSTTYIYANSSSGDSVIVQKINEKISFEPGVKIIYEYVWIKNRLIHKYPHK